jgi:hypothetical protein
MEAIHQIDQLFMTGELDKGIDRGGLNNGPIIVGATEQ